MTTMRFDEPSACRLKADTTSKLASDHGVATFVGWYASVIGRLVSAPHDELRLDVVDGLQDEVVLETDHVTQLRRRCRREEWEADLSSVLVR